MGHRPPTAPATTACRRLARAAAVAMLTTAPCISPCTAAPDTGAEAKAEYGPFFLDPVLAFYVVKDATPIRLRLKAQRWRALDKGDRVMIRVFDPEEKIIDRLYEAPGWMGVPPGVAEGAPLTALPAQRPRGKVGDVFLDKPVTLDGQPGVYEIRVVAGQHNTTLLLTSDQPLHYGVCAQNGSLRPWSDDALDLFCHTPADLAELALIQRGEGEIRVIDGAGQTHAVPKGRHVIPTGGKAALWQVRLPAERKWELRASTPVVFCPEREVAEQLRNSCSIAADGTRIVFRAQASLPRHVATLWTPGKVGAAKDLIQPLRTREAEWLKDPLRNNQLIGFYGVLSHVASALRIQDADNGRIKPGLPETLAYAYALDSDVNPYHGRAELKYRAVVGALLNLYDRIQEDETFDFALWPGVRISEDPYPGVAAFEFGTVHLPVYAALAQEIKAEAPQLYEDWTELLRRVVDRHIPSYLTSSRNQSAHYLVGFWHFYEGCREDAHRDLATRFIRRFANAASRAGYSRESCGPDATYQGLSNFYIAKACRMSGAPELRTLLQRVFQLFNHTVAPEPDGSLIGACNFSHRTPDSFVHAQYGGGWAPVADLIPEAGIWHKWKHARPDAPAKSREAILHNFENPLDDAWHADPKNYGRVFNSQIALTQYRYWTDPNRIDLRGYTWPALEEADFVRNFGDEFIAVKRRGWYALFYVGQPVSDWYIRFREQHRKPKPHEGDPEAKPWDFYGAENPTTPFTGGGLSLFRTPGYGTCFAGRNWAPTARHGLILTSTQDLRYWEEYGKVAFALAEDQSTLRVHGPIESQPVQYERLYALAPDALSYTLRLTATQDFEARSIVENFPVVAKHKSGEITVAKQDTPDGLTTSVTIRNQKSGCAVRLTFAPPLPVEAVANYTAGIGFVQAHLPANLSKDAPVALTVEIAQLPDAAR